MPPPNRTANTHYYYHIYDYPNSQAYTLSNQDNAGNRFYSIVADLADLCTTGQRSNVPNIELRAQVGATVPDGLGTNRNQVMLSFGGDTHNPANSPGVLLTGGIHAREWIAIEVTYLIAEYLIKNYTTNPQTTKQTELMNLINSRRIYVIPLLNPNGNHYTTDFAPPNNRLWRKNRRALSTTVDGWLKDLTSINPPEPNPPFTNVDIDEGEEEVTYDVPVYFRSVDLCQQPHRITFKVTNGLNGIDLNRNYALQHWGYEVIRRSDGQIIRSGDPDDLTYFGTIPASELETKNVQALCQQIAGGIHTAIDYHSYGKWILYPTVAHENGTVDPSYKQLGLILQRMIAAQLEYTRPYDYGLGPPVQKVLYDVMASIVDYEALECQARSFTIELDPEDTGQGNAGFELDRNQIMGVFEKNIRGALALIASAGGNPQATRGDCMQLHTINSNEASYLNWNVFGRGNQLP